jgi:DNA-directed RNA polymerase specialized sigma24 family protein
MWEVECTVGFFRSQKVRPKYCNLLLSQLLYGKRENRLVRLDTSEDSEFLEIEGNRFEQPEVPLMVDEAAQVFSEILRRLPEQNRNLILLKFIGEFDYNEISGLLDIKSLGTLKSCTHRSLRLMRRIAEEMNIQRRDLQIWADEMAMRGGTW